MLVRVDQRSETPIYLQIADSISRQISDGVLEAGDRLPAARSLAEGLGVNMHTVLKAYSQLESRGLVEMRRGRAGVVVSPVADVRGLVDRLVSSATRVGLSRGKVHEMIDDAWP